MKIKKILFLALCLIVLLLPNIVLAAETFTSGDYTYLIAKVNLKMDSLTGDEIFLEIDENNNYIFLNDKTNEFYKVNENECVLMSAEEIIKFANTPKEKDIAYSGYDIYEMQIKYLTTAGFIKTTDTTIDQNKIYSYFDKDNGFQLVEYPDVSKIDTYYEWADFKYPTSTEIDKDVTYYAKDENTSSFVEVANPIAEDIGKYCIKMNNLSDAWIETKIATLDSTIFDKILVDYNIYDFYIDEKTNELRIIVVNDNGFRIYTSDGILVLEKEINDIIEIATYSNSFFGITDAQGGFKIFDNEANIVFESDRQLFLRQIKYDNNVYKFIGEDEFGKYEFYNMYRSKIVTEDNDINTDIENSTNNDNNNVENNSTNNTLTNTNQNQNTGEKDETPKMGNNTTDNTVLFIGLLVISIVGILDTKKVK